MTKCLGKSIHISRICDISRLVLLAEWCHKRLLYGVQLFFNIKLTTRVTLIVLADPKDSHFEEVIFQNVPRFEL